MPYGSTQFNRMPCDSIQVIDLHASHGMHATAVTVLGDSPEISSLDNTSQNALVLITHGLSQSQLSHLGSERMNKLEKILGDSMGILQQLTKNKSCTHLLM